jgi:histidinol-phosphate/aromatic aminotransferase/cobyric acid decarboxylase-like protein
VTQRPIDRFWSIRSTIRASSWPGRSPKFTVSLACASAIPEAAARLSALRLQNGVTIVSVKAAIAALDDTAYVRMAAKRNSDDRQEFMNQVNARMLRAIDSHSNFVLLNPLRPVSEVIPHLEI